MPPKKLNTLDYHQLPIQEITKEEIQEAIFAASLFKGAGIDNILAVVW